MIDIECIACQKIIHLPENPDQDEDDFVICPHCKSIFEITWNNPPILTWAEDPIVTSSFRSCRKYIF